MNRRTGSVSPLSTLLSLLLSLAVTRLSERYMFCLLLVIAVGVITLAILSARRRRTENRGDSDGA